MVDAIGLAKKGAPQSGKTTLTSWEAAEAAMLSSMRQASLGLQPFQPAAGGEWSAYGYSGRPLLPASHSGLADRYYPPYLGPSYHSPSVGGEAAADAGLSSEVRSLIHGLDGLWIK